MQQKTGHEIFTRLAPVCSRRRKRALLQAMGRGLLRGAGVAVALGLVNLAISTTPPVSNMLPDASAWLIRWALLPGLAVVALLVGPLIGGWRAVGSKPDWHAAAAAVDRHYGLDDRTRTALTFLEKTDRTPLEEMQIADCTERLAGIDPGAVMPAGLPKPLPAALALSVLAVAAIAGPLAIQPPMGRPVAAQGTEAGPSTAAVPTEEQPSPDVPPSAPVADEHRWRVAPSAEVVVTRANLLDGAAFEEVISDEDRPGAAPGSVAPGEAKEITPGGPTQVVLEGEQIPLRHRRTVRRYFESIRPKGPAIPDQPPGPP